MLIEQDCIGVLISDNLQPSIQCANAAKKAMPALGLLQKSFKFFDEESFRILYKTYVRSHMETCIQAWAPYYKKDIQILEKGQRRATKLVPKLRKYPYEIRLKKLGILSLGQRRIRGDLIETFKIMKELNKSDREKFFMLATTDQTRGHNLKLFKPS